MNPYKEILGYAYDRHPLGKVDSITTDGDTVRLNVIYKDASIAKNIVSRTFRDPIPAIKRVIFNPPATIVMWDDDTKTVVKADKERYDPEKGLAMAISKKALGNKGNYFEEFKKHVTKDAQLESAGYNIAEGIKDGFAMAAEKMKNLAERMGKDTEIAKLRVTLNGSYERLFDVYTKRGATKADLVSAIETVLNEIGEVTNA